MKAKGEGASRFKLETIRYWRSGDQNKDRANHKVSSTRCARASTTLDVATKGKVDPDEGNKISRVLETAHRSDQSTDSKCRLWFHNWALVLILASPCSRARTGVAVAIDNSYLYRIPSLWLSSSRLFELILSAAPILPDYLPHSVDRDGCAARRHGINMKHSESASC